MLVAIQEISARETLKDSVQQIDLGGFKHLHAARAPAVELIRDFLGDATGFA